MNTTKYIPATRTSLAKQYRVSLETMKKWLDKIPAISLERNERVFTPKQVEIIITHLGEPPD